MPGGRYRFEYELLRFLLYEAGDAVVFAFAIHDLTPGFEITYCPTAIDIRAGHTGEPPHITPTLRETSPPLQNPLQKKKKRFLARSMIIFPINSNYAGYSILIVFKNTCQASGTLSSTGAGPQQRPRTFIRPHFSRCRSKKTHGTHAEIYVE